MSSKRRLQEEFAHMSGFGSLVCHPNNRHVWTCGADGAIRCYDTHLNLVAAFEQQHIGNVRAIALAPSGDALASGGDDRSVRYYAITESGAKPELKLETTVTTMSGTVHALSIRANGNELAMAGDDRELKIANLIDTTRIHPVHGHAGAVKFCAFDGDGERLASIDAIGTLHVNSVSDGKSLFIENIMPKFDASKTTQMARAAWSRDSQYLAQPGAKDIPVRTASSSFKHLHAVLKGGHSAPVSVMAFSPNDAYLASVGADKKLVVWDLDAKESVASIEIDANILAVDWLGRDNALVLFDDNGYIRKWDKPVPSHMPLPFDETEVVEKLPAKSGEPEATSTEELAPIGDVDEEDDGAKDNLYDDPKNDGEPQPRRSRLRKAVQSQRRPRDHDEDVDDVDEFEDDDEMANFIEDDTDGACKVDEFLERSERKKLTSAQAAQPAFQSSSTPIDLETKRRFLCWNLIGSVISTSHETFHGIEINFADSNKHKPLKLKDHYGLHIATLTEHGCVMASPYQDKTRPAVVTFRQFDSWAENSDWVLHLTAPESPLCVAAGKRFIAVATDRQFLRILGLTGVQLSVMSLKGPVVTMAAFDDQLAIIYHSGSASLPEHQNLEMLVLDIKKKQRTALSAVSLSPAARLTWLSFSEHGLLLSMDSAGVLRGLTSQWDWSWIPLLDSNTIANKGKSDIYWPVGLIESQLMCAMCRGAKWPSAVNRPILTGVTLSLPFVPTDTSALEEQHARGELLLNAQIMSRHSRPSTYKEQAALDKPLVMLVQQACLANQSARALELAASMSLLKSLELALALANNSRKVALAGRIGLLIGAKKREMELEKAKTHTVTSAPVASPSSSHVPGPKMSINRFVNEGNAKADEAKKRRLAQMVAEESVAATDANPSIRITGSGSSTVIEVEDEGETELTYAANGAKRAKTVDRTGVVEAVKAKIDEERRQEQQIQQRGEAMKKAAAEIVEMDDESAGASSGTAKGLDFLSQFRLQKQREKAEKDKEVVKETEVVAKDKKAKKPAASESVATRSPSVMEAKRAGTIAASPAASASSSSVPRLNPFAVRVSANA